MSKFEKVFVTAIGFFAATAVYCASLKAGINTVYMLGVMHGVFVAIFVAVLSEQEQRRAKS